MKIVGIRCSNTDYAYCALSGDFGSPHIDDVKQVPYPKAYSEAEILKWLFQEFTALFSGYKPEKAGIKRAETNVKRSNSLEFRIQAEAIVSLAAAEVGCMSVERKVNATIAKGLRLKGKAKYLQTTLDTSPIEHFERYSVKEKEAILAAWSCMG